MPTREATGVGTILANAKPMPTQGATKVGTLIANAKLMPTFAVETCEYSRRHECVDQCRTL